MDKDSTFSTPVSFVPSHLFLPLFFILFFGLELTCISLTFIHVTLDQLLTASGKLLPTFHSLFLTVFSYFFFHPSKLSLLQYASLLQCRFCPFMSLAPRGLINHLFTKHSIKSTFLLKFCMKIVNQT